MSEEQRRHFRITTNFMVKITDATGNTFTSEVRDYSESGLFVLTEVPPMPPLGEIVKVQVQGLMDDAPIRDMKVIRLTGDGVGLKFCED